MRIVFADDHESFRGIITNLLRDAGYEVHPVAQGSDLLGVVETVTPDVIVCHARFADLPALDALELVTARTRVPTILTSGDVRSIPRDRAAKLGVVYYLQKPFSMNELLGALDAAVRLGRLSAAS